MWRMPWSMGKAWPRRSPDRAFWGIWIQSRTLRGRLNSPVGPFEWIRATLDWRSRDWLTETNVAIVVTRYNDRYAIGVFRSLNRKDRSGDEAEKEAA